MTTQNTPPDGWATPPHQGAALPQEDAHSAPLGTPLQVQPAYPQSLLRYAAHLHHRLALLRLVTQSAAILGEKPLQKRSGQGAFVPVRQPRTAAPSPALLNIRLRRLDRQLRLRAA